MYLITKHETLRSLSPVNRQLLQQTSMEVQGDTKKGNFWKTQQKLKKSKKKKIIDKN